MSNKAQTEIIACNDKGEFYISCQDNQKNEIGKKPIEEWQNGLSKSQKCCLIIRRELPNIGNLSSETIPELYQVDLTYKVNAKAKSIYLTTVTVKKDNGSRILQIYRKDINEGSTQQIPIPSTLCESMEEFGLTCKRSKGTLITVKEGADLLRSGTCLGIYSVDLTRRYLI